MADIVPKEDLHRVVMTAIIYQKDDEEIRYLAVRRSPDKKVFPNLWVVPGGGLEPADYQNRPKTTEDAWYFALEDALRREIKEEVNLEIGKPKYLLDLVFIRPDKIPVLTLSYYAPYDSGEVVLEEGDLVDYAWIDLDQAKKLDFIPGVYEEMVMVDEILKGKSDAIYSS